MHSFVTSFLAQHCTHRLVLGRLRQLKCCAGSALLQCWRNCPARQFSFAAWIQWDQTKLLLSHPHTRVRLPTLSNTRWLTSSEPFAFWVHGQHEDRDHAVSVAVENEAVVANESKAQVVQHPIPANPEELWALLTCVYHWTWTGSRWTFEKMGAAWVRRLKACVAAKGGCFSSSTEQ